MSLLQAAGPRRIVSTSPAITETLYALNLGDRVVGVTTYCHYPPDARTKPKIGDFMHPNIEAILALRPDLVVTETTGIRASVKLPMPVLEVDTGSLAAIFDATGKIGAAAGVPDRARALIASLRAGLNDVRARTSRFARRRAIFIAGRTPGRLEDLIAAGRGTHITELIEIAGGVNIFRDSVATYSKVSLEELIARNPEVVIDMGEMAQTEGVTEAQKHAVVELWSRLPVLAAVQEHRVYAIASDIFVVPGPRVVEAARALARMLHPEAGL